MYSSVTAAFTLFACLVAAAPSIPGTPALQKRGQPPYSPPSSIYTPVYSPSSSYTPPYLPSSSPYPPTPEPTCVECPPEPCFNCTKGCIYIECDDCGDQECCKSLGLDKYTPYFLYYPFYYPPAADSIQVAPNPGDLTHHSFEYCSDYNFYGLSAPVLPLGFASSDGEWTLGAPAPGDFAIGSDGLVGVGNIPDTSDFWACNQNGTLRLFYDTQKPACEDCCPVKVYFTKKLG